MALTPKPFNDVFTYTRGTGATRVNAAGLIVGVDFSSTSNTIATGSKTFTLTADANVNRDWPVGSSVIAVSQAGATGSMTGTVTSYTPSTQVLVLNIASVTGSGTSTNWRLGSLEFRRDFDPVTLQPRGGLVEGGATNFYLGDKLSSAYWIKIGANAVDNQALSVTGSQNSDLLREDTSTGLHAFRRADVGGFISGQIYTFKTFVKPMGRRYLALYQAVTLSESASVVFDLQSGTVNTSGAFGAFSLVDFGIRQYPNGIFEVWNTCFYVGSGNNFQVCYMQQTPFIGANMDAGSQYTGDGTSGMLFFGASSNLGANTSYIPTTTVSVTRAADLLSVDSTRFSQFYNNTQGTLVVEMTPIAAAVSAVAASLNDGTVNNAIRVQQKQSGTLSSIRKMATDGVTDVMAINATGNNTLRSNGVDYTEISDQSAQVKLGVASSGVGQFLNVGGTENFRSSADSGLTYNARTIGGIFLGAHFGLNRFIIASGTTTINGATVGSVIVSPDGLALRRINIPGLTQQLNEITSNTTNGTDGSIVLAVGAGGVLYTSADCGETWTARTSGVATAFNATAFGAATFVAVNNTAANSRYSTDGGATWNAVTGLTGTMTDIEWTGSQFVAINTVGGVFTSANGQAFTAVTTTGITPAFTSAQGIAFATIGGNGYFVIVGNGGQVAVSQTAAGASPATWTTYTNGGTPSTNLGGSTAFEAVAFQNKFYIVGSAGAMSEFDPIAVTFTLRTPTTTGDLFLCATNGSILLVGGTQFTSPPNGVIATTANGTTFTSRTGNGATLNGAAFGAGTYVVVGNAVNGSGLIATVDPVTFAYTRRVSNTAQSVNDVLFNGTRFIAGANNSVITYSDNNGATWTAVTIGGTAFNIQRIVANGNTVLAVGSGGRYSISTDNGATWASSALNGVTTQQLNGAAFFGGIYVIAGNAGTIITTTNGTTYTLRTSGTTANLFSVMYSARDSMWYAAGDNGVILSAIDPTQPWENISNDAVGAVINGGVVQANPFLPNLTPLAINRMALRLAPNNFGASVNGAAVASDLTVSLPLVDRLSIGMNGVNGQQFNGWIGKIAFRTDAQADASLVGLANGSIDMFTEAELP